MKLISRNVGADIRLLTSPFRVRPNFVIAGEAKCGTTSLYRYLQQHPDIFTADAKEPRNFIDHPTSLLQCQRHYPTVAWKLIHRLRGRSKFIAGEATAEYFACRSVPRALSNLIPHAKVIVLLRNPAFRALSDHEMFRDRELVQEDFGSLVDRSIRWLSNPETYPWLLDASQVEHSTIRYVLRGIYVESAARWLDCISKDNLLFVRSEDIFAAPTNVVDDIFRFLNLDPYTIDTTEIQRQGNYEWRHHRETLHRLNKFYEPHNERLYELLQRDLEWDEDFHRIMASCPDENKHSGVLASSATCNRLSDPH